MNEIDLIPTRASLLSQIRDPGNNESWRVFFDTYGKLIYGTAIQAGLSRTEAEEVVQETVLCVARKIPGFNYDPTKGSFKGWLLKLTRWRIIDQFRKRRNCETSLSKDERLAEAEGIADEKSPLDGYWEREWEGSMMNAALDRLRKRVEPRHFQVFQQYVLNEEPVSEVCRRLKVSAAQVYLIKHRVGSELKKELQELKKEDFL